MRSSWIGLVRYLAKVVLLAALYIVLARLGLRFDPVSGFATLVWPPTGLSLAALVLFGQDLWPGVAVGAAVVNVWIGAPILVASGIALGNTLEALLGAYALWRVPGFRPGLSRVADVVALVVVALLSTAVAATVGVTSLRLGGLVQTSRFVETWVAWWQGDVLGDLVVAAFVMTWVSVVWSRMTARRGAEALALTLVLLGASVFLFGGNPAAQGGLSAFQQPITLLPLLIWAAMRFESSGATGATLLVSIVAVWSTAKGHGPFIRTELHQSLAVVQAFMSVVAVTFLVLAAVTAERRRADRERTELFHREQVARAYAEELQQLRQK